MLDTEIDKTATAKSTPGPVTQLTVNQLIILLNIFLLAGKLPHWNDTARGADDTFEADMDVLISTGLIVLPTPEAYEAIRKRDHSGMLTSKGHNYIRQICYLPQNDVS